MKSYLAILGFCLVTSLASAKSDGLLIAAEDDWYPYSAKRGNSVEGRSVDLVKAAYDAVGVKVNFATVPFNRGMVLTKAGRYVAVFNGGLFEDTKRDYLFPRNSLAKSEQVVIGRLGEVYSDLKSFNGKRLALTLGYTYAPEILNDKKNKIERAPGDANCLKMVAADRADYTIMDRLVAQSIIAQDASLKGRLSIVGRLTDDDIHILFAKTEAGEKARQLFDEGMDKLRSTGELKAIIDRWDDKFR